MRTKLRRRAALTIAATAATGLVLSGCSGSGSGHKSKGKNRGSSSRGSSSVGKSSGSSSVGKSSGGVGKDDDHATSTGGTSTGGTSTGGTSTGGTSTGSRSGPCTSSETRMSVRAVSRPVNYRLITLTNTSKRTCTVLSYPVVSFAPDLDGTAEAFAGSRPQAVVTLKPGASAYAGLNTSPANRADDGNKPHAKTLAVDLISKVEANGSTRQFGRPQTVRVGDLFVYEPKVTYWQQNQAAALR